MCVTLKCIFYFYFYFSVAWFESDSEGHQAPGLFLDSGHFGCRLWT